MNNALLLGFSQGCLPHPRRRGPAPQLCPPQVDTAGFRRAHSWHEERSPALAGWLSPPGWPLELDPGNAPQEASRTGPVHDIRPLELGSVLQRRPLPHEAALQVCPL
ncbi:hypothetical protein NDU88_000635 [Pleurodeles waltl]|uniref:Uncharacterized protein n=1 Tax=Pleurodeles waltl TaxID=8319 RepID=A0AAV7LVE5_PLEWA|nr:hypothetical protein NDU88_000635 [Pleurodeles waltl]